MNCPFIETQPPSSLTSNLLVSFDGLDCTEQNLQDAMYAIDAKLPSLACVDTDECVATVNTNECGQNGRKKRSASLSFIVNLIAEVVSDGSGLNLADVLENNTGMH